MRNFKRAVTALVPGLVAAVLVGCGGGGHRDQGQADAAKVPEPASDKYANRCAADNSDAPAAQRTGTRSTEMAWLRAMLTERYLWGDDLPKLDMSAARYQGSPTETVDHDTAMSRWFNDLVHPADATQVRDHFSYRINASVAQSSDAGENSNWGMKLAVAALNPRRIMVMAVSGNSPAAQAGVRRGDELISLDGVPIATTDAAALEKLDANLITPTPGATGRWTLLRDGQQLERTMVASSYQSDPVSLVKVLGPEAGLAEPVGYVVFNEFTMPAQKSLIDAFQQLTRAQVRDVIVDLRYNGGGHGFISSELAYMVAGDATKGKLFFKEKMNARRAAAGEESTQPFITATCNIESAQAGGSIEEACTGAPLPTLNLRRVYVLTGRGTCSASELFMNGLRGTDVEVIQIGDRTCGKPYGFSAISNCGASNFAIEFQIANAKGFSDYPNGFQPGGTGPTGLPGCAVPDDVGHALGDPQEAMLAAALNFRATGQCPSASAGV